MVQTNLRFIHKLAIKALDKEVSLTPKPGLVDTQNSGAHHDMNWHTFQSSISALSPYLLSYLEIGYQQADVSPRALFDKLRDCGIQAEKAMFQATNAVNTHKGANFLFAIILGSIGRYIRINESFNTDTIVFTVDDTQAIFSFIKKMTAHLISQDFKSLHLKHNLTYGEKLYLEHGIKGPRGEAAEGFTSITHYALPFLRKHYQSSYDTFSLVKTLIYLMSFVEDGNIIHRGGITAWKNIKKDASDLLEKRLSPDAFIQQIQTFDHQLIHQHLSPGGSADLLSVTILFGFLENIIPYDI